MNKLAKLVRDARIAASRSGRSVVAILLEAIELRVTGNQLGTGEYLDLALYQNDLTREQKKRFAGYRFVGYCEENHHINSPSWGAVAQDKLFFYSYARAIGIPMPKLFAVYCPRHRTVQSDITFVDTPDGLHQLLRDCRQPLFAKPIESKYGRGARRILPCEDNSEVLRDSQRGELPLSELVKELVAAVAAEEYQGYLFQHVLEPHADLRRLAGPMVSGMRIGILNRHAGPEIYRGVLKINRGDSATDNFEHGLSGNLLGDIDIKTGTVSHAITGSGFSLQSIETHPTTNATLPGFQIPYWPEVTKLAHQIGSSLPELRVIGADIVVTPEGPVALEVNLPGDFDLLQIASRRGVFEEPGMVEMLDAARRKQWKRARNAASLLRRSVRY